MNHWPQTNFLGSTDIQYLYYDICIVTAFERSLVCLNETTFEYLAVTCSNYRQIIPNSDGREVLSSDQTRQAVSNRRLILRLHYPPWNSHTKPIRFNKINRELKRTLLKSLFKLTEYANLVFLWWNSDVHCILVEWSLFHVFRMKLNVLNWPLY